MTHDEMTKHIRHRIKVAGIKASVRKFVACGSEIIQVSVPAPRMTFSEDEQRRIRLIASANELTWVRGLPIDIEQMTNPESFEFYLR